MARDFSPSAGCGEVQSDQRGVDWRGAVVRTLFAFVSLLLLADLDSSYRTSRAAWEVNPFISALSEQVGPLAALMAFKAVDFVCLAALYVCWKRWRANVATSIVLSIAALEYFQIVVDNYHG